MSEQPGEREWRLYIDDMITFAERALDYTSALDREAFAADRLRYDATLRNIELIGEAASRVPREIRDEHPEVPWRQMIATRNRLAHAYLGLDDDVIWSIVRDDLAPLLESLRGFSREQAP